MLARLSTAHIHGASVGEDRLVSPRATQSCPRECSEGGTERNDPPGRLSQLRRRSYSSAYLATKLRTQRPLHAYTMSAHVRLCILPRFITRHPHAHSRAPHAPRRAFRPPRQDAPEPLPLEPADAVVDGARTRQDGAAVERQRQSADTRERGHREDG